MRYDTPHVTSRITKHAAPYTPLILRIGAVVLALGVGCRTARGQEPRYCEQACLPAAHDWSFRQAHPEANGLLNAFGYGHAVLAERLHAPHGAPARRRPLPRLDDGGDDDGGVAGDVARDGGGADGRGVVRPRAAGAGTLTP
jgi:hypothetical protein